MSAGLRYQLRLDGEPFDGGRLYRTSAPVWAAYRRQVGYLPALHDRFGVWEISEAGARKLPVPDLDAILAPPAGTYYQVFLDDAPYSEGQRFRQAFAAWRLYDRVLIRRPAYRSRLSVRETSSDGVRILEDG
jgi:hypothetical protein